MFKKKLLFLFDIDGTLTEPRQIMDNQVKELLKTLKDQGIILAVVGGSDFSKAYEQVGKNIFELFTYVFSENGLVFYKNGVLQHKKSLRTYFTQEQLNNFINYTLRMIADLNIPVKTGTFIEYRNGMINISPIGRACTIEQRNDFEKLDLEKGIRKQMISKLQHEFKEMGLRYSIGGQISFDVFPEGTDKTFCLQYLPDSNHEIHFFGDKTNPGENDYEIYSDPRVIGHRVNNVCDTIKICTNIITTYVSGE